MTGRNAALLLAMTPTVFGQELNFGVAQLASAPADAEKTLRGAMAASLTLQPERHVTVFALLNATAWPRLRRRAFNGTASLSAQSLELAPDPLGAPKILE